MQAYFMTRGKIDEVQHFIDWMKTRFMPLMVKHPNGTITNDILMECQLRPIQLWEFVFPKEYLDLVTNSLDLANKNTRFLTGGYNINPKLYALRLMLGAKEFETPKDTNSKMPLPYERWRDVNILPIGYREDAEITEPNGDVHERI